MLVIWIHAMCCVRVGWLSFSSDALRETKDVSGSVYVVPVTDSVCSYLSSNMRLPDGTSNQAALKTTLAMSK